MYKIKWIIDYLSNENSYSISLDKLNMFDKYRYFVNIREPKEISSEFLEIQDEFLKECIMKRGTTSLEDIRAINNNIYLWSGDITTLEVDGIVNAGNSGLTGCYHPLHKCIDNAIHTYAGVQLRLACSELIEKQGTLEETGSCKITSGYNLPAKYVLHTVGPIIYNELTMKDCKDLASCYKSCLEVAELNNLKSIAFCCISTGEFRFPNEKAAEIAIKTVKEYLRETKSEMKVIFNVFKDKDYDIYRRLL